MLRLFLLSLCWTIALSLSPIEGQEALATWKGTLDARGTKLRLEIDIADGGQQLSGVLRSLDQGNATLELTDIVQAEESLSFSIPQINASFSGKLKENGSKVSGTFLQGGIELPLTLSKSDPAAASGPTPQLKPDEKLDAAWIGELNLGIMKPVMQFRIVTKKSGESAAYFDSITEGRTDFPATWSMEGDQLNFDVAEIKLTYRGTVNDAGDEAEGTWSQGGAKSH